MQDDYKNIDTVLFQLPEKVLFIIAKQFIGKIKTPFNKQQIIEDISIFFQKKENIEGLFNQIDQKDLIILQALSLLKEAELKDIQDFIYPLLEGEECEERTYNLERRLLLYRSKEDHYKKLRPFPYFNQRLQEQFFHFSLLCPAKTSSQKEFPEIWLNDCFLAAFINLHLDEKSVNKKDGELKKGKAKRFRLLFPEIFEDETTEIILKNLMSMLKNCSLLDPSNEEIIYSKCLELAELDTETRQDFIFSAYCAGSFSLEDFLHAFKFIKINLPLDAAFKKEDLLRFFYYGFTAKQRRTAEKCRQLFKKLLELRFIFKNDEGYYQRNPFWPEKPKETGKLTITANFEVSLQPPLPFKDLLLLLPAFELQSFTRHPNFEINKQSFKRLCDNQIKGEEWLDLLDKHSQNTLPQNIKITVQHWLKEYRSIRVYQALLLELDNEKSFILENLPSVQMYIQKKLGQGLYIMNAQRQKEWEGELENADIGPLPKTINFLENEQAEYHGPSLRKIAQYQLQDFSIPWQNDDQKNKIRARRELERAITESKINKNHKDHLKEMLKKGLIVSKEQINEEIVDELGQSQAKGMDYNKKINLLKKTMNNHSSKILVRYMDPEQGDYAQKVLVPTDLQKEEDDFILLAKDRDDQAMEIPVSKISLIKEVQGSIYFG